MKNIKEKPRYHIIGLFTLILMGVIFLTGCGGIVPGDDVSKLVPTYAAQTLQALSVEQTITSYETVIAQLTKTAQVTPTPEATATAVAPTVTPTVLSIPCNWVAYVKDVTIPDNTKIGPGTLFTKTWRIKNIGSCTWTTDYDFVLVSGSSMNAATRIGLPGTVYPGQTIDISVMMEAPKEDGIYTGYWMLADANGNQFGIGPSADGSIWVKINVSSQPKVVYDFTEKMCSARWDSSASIPSSLPCPGQETDDAMGYVVRKVTPFREDGGKENEHGLVMSPDNTSNTSSIVGFFPSFTVETGDEFRAVISCEYGSTRCDVKFSLIAQLGSDLNETLGTWHEVNEGQYRSIVVDLSSLAGKEVNFILKVSNNNTTADNEALWLYPRIIRQ